MTFLYFILLSLGIILFWGGANYQKNSLELIGLLSSLILLVFLKIKNKKIKFPPFFSFYAIFLFVLAVYSLLRFGLKGNFEYLLLFTSGGLFYVVFYNLGKKFSDPFGWLTVFLGVLFFGGYILSKIRGLGIPWGHGLIAPYTQNHHHLGDFLVVPSLFLLSKIREEKKTWYLALFLPALILIILSFSRSAYLALALGAAFIFSEARLLILGLLALFFLLSGIFKTTLFSRIYFLQAVYGIIKNPIGVGMGNFGLISKSLLNTFAGERVSSFLTHNLFLEVLTGIGIFGLIFLYWFYQVSKTILKSKNIIYKSIFFALTVNFFFDTTYIIPTMLWLWFMALGLAQESNA